MHVVDAAIEIVLHFLHVLAQVVEHIFQTILGVSSRLLQGPKIGEAGIFYQVEVVLLHFGSTYSQMSRQPVRVSIPWT